MRAVRLGGAGRGLTASDGRRRAADQLEQLGDVEVRAAADVEDVVAGSGAERGADQLAPAQHVARRVEPLQPLAWADRSAGGETRRISAAPSRRTGRRPEALGPLGWRRP